MCANVSSSLTISVVSAAAGLLYWRVNLPVRAYLSTESTSELIERVMGEERRAARINVPARAAKKPRAQMRVLSRMASSRAYCDSEMTSVQFKEGIGTKTLMCEANRSPGVRRRIGVPAADFSF